MRKNTTLKPAQLKGFAGFAARAARKAGAIIAGDFEKKRRFTYKLNAFDLLTKTDSASEKLIAGMIRQKFPGHTIIGEESGKHAFSEDFAWHIDPLDGTSNFAKGFPYFCVSVGLAWRGIPVAGAVYNPLTREMFRAYKGGGAFLNSSRIRVSATRNLSAAFVATGLPADRKKHRKRLLRNYSWLMERVLGIKCLGSAALMMCDVARGRLDAYVAADIFSWDALAGCVIVREAGGRVLQSDGKEWTAGSRDMLVSNKHLAKELLKIKG